MRKLFLALVIAATLSTTKPASSGGIPVFDEANLAELLSQAAILVQQLTTLSNILSNMTGVTGHAVMLPSPVRRLHDFLPQTEIDPELLLQGPFKELIDELRKIEEEYSVGELFGDEVHLTGAARQYKARSDFIYSYMTLAKEAYENISARRVTLEGFNEALKTATSQKSVLDLNTRIAAEHALLLNDIAQLQALQLMAMMQDKSMIHNAQGLHATRATEVKDLKFK